MAVCVDGEEFVVYEHFSKKVFFGVKEVFFVPKEVNFVIKVGGL